MFMVTITLFSSDGAPLITSGRPVFTTLQIICLTTLPVRPSCGSKQHSWGQCILSFGRCHTCLDSLKKSKSSLWFQLRDGQQATWVCIHRLCLLHNLWLLSRKDLLRMERLHYQNLAYKSTVPPCTSKRNWAGSGNHWLILNLFFDVHKITVTLLITGSSRPFPCSCRSSSWQKLSSPL